MKEKEYGKLLTPAEVKALLEKELKNREEISYEQKLTLSHVDRIKKVPGDNSRKLVEELLKMERVSELLAHKIVEVIPQDFDDLDVIYQKERFRLSDEEKEQVLSLIKKYS